MQLRVVVRGRGTLLALCTRAPTHCTGETLRARVGQPGWLLGRCFSPTLATHCRHLPPPTPPPPPTHTPHARAVDGFEVPFTHAGQTLSVDVPQVGSLHAGRQHQEVLVHF